MNEIKIIKRLLEGKSNEQKIEFCNQCLEESEKYTSHRIFALKEYLQTLK